MDLDWLTFSEKNQTTEKLKDFSVINTDQIIVESQRMKDIREEEYADNTDNKVTIPSDLVKEFEWIFPEEDVIIESSEEKTKLNKLKKDLYHKLWLSEILEENSDMQKFEKWLLDWWLLDNIEMLNDLVNSSLEEIINIMKQLSNWETIKAILIDLYDSLEDITKIFTDPYSWWVALWALWIWPLSKGLNSIKLAEKFWKKENIELLKKYSESLWEELKLDDIIWEWNNAIIVAHPTKSDKVLKIAKEWRNIDRLDIEFENHTKFRYKLKELKKEYVWLDELKQIDNFYIPWIKNFNWVEGIYEMDRINWLSLKSLVHIDFNKENLVNIPEWLYKWLSQDKLIKLFKDNWINDKSISLIKTRWINDSDVMNFLKFKWLKTYPEWKNWHKEKNKPYVEDFIRTWFKNEVYKKEITPFNDIMRKNWFNHNDIHWWNYMIWEKWEINMIDFWNSGIKKIIK